MCRPICWTERTSRPAPGLVHHVFPAGDIAELLHQFLCGAVFQDAPLVQDDDLLKDGGGLLYDVSRDQEGPPRLDKVLQQQLIEALPHHHIQPRRRLIQNGDGCPAGQGDQDGHHRHLPLGQLTDLLFWFQLKLVQQAVGILLVPVGVEYGGRLQVVPDLLVVGT